MPEVPTRILKKLESLADLQEWISEADACKLLGIEKKTIQNKVSKKTIPTDFYTRTVVGTRVYNKKKLLLLE